MDLLGLQSAIDQLMARVEALEAKTAAQENQEVSDLKDWLMSLEFRASLVQKESK